MASSSSYPKSPWWSLEILKARFNESEPIEPFDIDDFKTEVASCTTDYRSPEGGTPWKPSLFDIDTIIAMLCYDTVLPTDYARRWVLNRQWSDKEPKRYQELGMVCICGRDTFGTVYMRKENADKRDKSGLGLPRAGYCGSQKVWVLNPMSKAYAAKTLDKHAVRLHKKPFKDMDSKQRAEVLKDVMQDRKDLVFKWLSCQEDVKKAEAEVGKKDGPSKLQKRKNEVVAAKERLDDAGGVLLWDKAYNDMPKVQDDDFS